ncbi:RELT-like protein 2 [Heptranchias perlo]|uniref:RELT-like protein 2 n=1 Tax=Heptranchias perlo TaxID=212740 RepID=UPI003559C8D6
MGILLCHVLQEKGYHCRTSREPNSEREARLTTGPDDLQETNESNQDTVEQIVQCIIENEANMEALKEMLKDHEEVERPVLRPLFPQQIVTKSPALVPHHHTVHSGAAAGARSACLHCNQRRKRASLHVHRRAREVKGRGQGVEVTVLSIGRFRVTHVEKSRGVQELYTLPAIEVCARGDSVRTETETETDWDKPVNCSETAATGGSDPVRPGQVPDPAQI